MATRKAEIGRKIREARVGKGWKQKHLAAHVEVEPITVSRWERGATTPDLDVLRVVAEATGKPLSYFVDQGPEAPEPAALEVAVERIESAADRVAAAAERIAELLEKKA
jgi:transcriptional regulator with XRE-family HTH domain